MMGIFELIYYLGYRVKTASDLRRRRRLPARVISMGNITTGGTGKTPAAIALAMEAKKRGHRPCILTRGYRGRLKGPVLVTPGMDGADVGDEPLLMARKLDGVPVVKGAERYASGVHALEHLSPAPDVFILDDGFQHRRLHRDTDVLLVNAMNPFDNMKLLPVGLLREPLSQMKRADIVVITKSEGEDTSGLVEMIRHYNPHAPVFLSRHVPLSVDEPGGRSYPLAWLEGKAVYAFSGIAEPGHFTGVLEDSGADVRGGRAFRDHHVFTPQDISRVERDARRSGADWIITTEKDIMRLKGFTLPENLLTLGIGFEVDTKFYDLVFNFK